MVRPIEDIPTPPTPCNDVTSLSVYQVITASAMNITVLAKCMSDAVDTVENDADVIAVECKRIAEIEYLDIDGVRECISRLMQ